MVEIKPTDFKAHRRFLEEVEREMYIDAGLAQRSDEEKLLRLVRDSLSNCQNKVDRGQGVGFCAIENSEPIGCVYATVNGLDKKAFITSVYVKERHRGVGIGRQLIQFLLDELAKRAILDVGLAVTATNERALKLYDSFGFVVRRHIMQRITKPGRTV
jgi:ribosomal protein S18 acetylase RimI-like enzyme